MSIEQNAAFEAWYAEYIAHGIDNNDGLFEPDVVDVARSSWQAALLTGAGARIAELQAEKTGLESIVTAQAATIAELRAAAAAAQEPVAEVVAQDTQFHGYARAIRCLSSMIKPGTKLYCGPQPPAGAQPAAIPSGVLVFDGGSLHVRDDGSGCIVVPEDQFALEDDRCEGPDGPQGSIHWLARIPASEMAALRDFMNAQPAASADPVELDIDRVLSIADVHADESRENGVRRFDRGGLFAFAQDVLRVAAPPAAGQVQQDKSRLSLDDDGLDRIATILNRHEAGEIGLQGVAEEILHTFFGQAQQPYVWTPGPDEFKDWCANWFGPDSDESYLADAIFNLPPMAQKFSRSFAQQDAEKVDAQPIDDGFCLADLEAAAWTAWNHQRSLRVCNDEAECMRAAIGAVITALPIPAQPTPAMAGDVWLDIMEDLLLEHIGGYDERKSVMAHARKRVQPASGEDAQRLDWLTEQLVDTIYMDDGRIIDMGGRVKPHDVRAAIDAAMQQEGQS